MPRLPQVVQNQPLQGSGLSIGSAMAPGEAAASLGRDVASIGTEMTQRIINIQRANQVMTKSAQGAEAAAKLYDQIKNDPTVPDAELAQRVQDGFKILHDNIGADIKDRQVREIFDNNFQGLTTAHVVDAVSEGRRRIISTANAGRAESNDTNVNLAVTYPGGPIHDKAIADLMANTDSAVANKMITAEEGQKEKSLNLDKIEVGGVLRQIREDPSTAFADLQDPQKYTNLDAVMRQRLTTYAWNMVQANAQQALTNMRANEAEAAKLRHENIGQEDSQLTVLADQGKLTHQKLAETVQKWTAKGLEGFPAARIEVLGNMIDKPHESPSDPVIFRAAESGVTEPTPTVTKKQLHDWLHTGLLDTKDYIALDNKLTETLRYNQDQHLQEMRSRETVLDNLLRNHFAGTPEVYELARKDAAEASAARGGAKDPMSLFEPLVKKYDPMLVEPFGPSVAKARQEFGSSQKALETAEQSQRNWNTNNTFWKPLMGTENPYNIRVDDAKQELVKKAKASKHYVGEAPPGTPEGQRLDPVLGWIYVANGSVIRLD